MSQSAQKLLLQIARNPEPQEAFDALKKGRMFKVHIRKSCRTKLTLE